MKTFDETGLWVHYTESACPVGATRDGLTPWHHIFIQAPRKDADVIILALSGFDPEYLTCDEHETTAYTVTEDCDLAGDPPMYLIAGSGDQTFRFIGYDHAAHIVAYVEAGIRGSFAGKFWQRDHEKEA